MNGTLRLPDYVIAGMMKSGTSSLYSWLSHQPECEAALEKEPDFFSCKDAWKRGLSWYSDLFGHATSDKLIGEASTSYTKPYLGAADAASRMAAVMQEVRLIFVVRDPIERLRSHYRHEVRRGRERRTLLEAVSAPGNHYVALSRYNDCLSPYLQRFPREQICIVRLEDLTSETAPGWTQVLDHLGLPPRRPPRTAHNVTAHQPSYTRAMLWLWEAGHYRRLRQRLPGPVRHVARALLLREGRQQDDRFQPSSAELPPELTAPIWQDVHRLETWLGSTQPLWDRISDPSHPNDAMAAATTGQLDSDAPGEGTRP